MIVLNPGGPGSFTCSGSRSHKKTRSLSVSCIGHTPKSDVDATLETMCKMTKSSQENGTRVILQSELGKACAAGQALPMLRILGEILLMDTSLVIFDLSRVQTARLDNYRGFRRRRRK